MYLITKFPVGHTVFRFPVEFPEVCEQFSFQLSWNLFFINPDFLEIQIWRKTRKLQQLEIATKLPKSLIGTFIWLNLVRIW